MENWIHFNGSQLSLKENLNSLTCLNRALSYLVLPYLLGSLAMAFPIIIDKLKQVLTPTCVHTHTDPLSALRIHNALYLQVSERAIYSTCKHLLLVICMSSSQALVSIKIPATEWVLNKLYYRNMAKEQDI